MVQRSLRPPGGGNAVAAWMVHALTGTHEIATLTTGEWSVQETNAFYGTAIPDTITRLVVRPPWRWLARLPDDQLTRLRMCSVLGDARSLEHRFDVMISADNFAPFAKPGVQYVYFPALLQPPPARWRPLVEIYFKLCDARLGAAWGDAVNNVTLVTSQWTALGLERLGEISRPIVLYPPVVDPGAGLPWDQRDDVVLCIGRFHPSKRIETAIAIVNRIRDEVLPSTRMIVVGSSVDRTYTMRLRSLAAPYGGWLEFREDLSRNELNTLMGRCRYGLQAMVGEHFGMATAEMVRAGCVVFAHRSGGSPEVLNHEDALLWTDEDDAVDKFRRMDVAKVRERLRSHATAFSTEQFVTQFRDVMATLVAGSQHR